MTVRTVPAVLATLAALGALPLLFAPYVAHQHRRRGEFRVRAGVVAFALLLYCLALVAYVLLPLPEPGACARGSSPTPRLLPLHTLFDPLSAGRGSLLAALTGPMLRQGALNVALFVPLGVFARGLLSTGRALPATLGFGVSLAVECTQLTSMWGLYDCSVRLFDVDDLLANTAGAWLGASCTPVLRLVRERGPAVAADLPRPVLAGRRLTGMCCDALLLWCTGTALLAGADLLLRSGIPLPTSARPWLVAVSVWTIPGLLCLTTPNGASLGQHAVRLRWVGPDGSPPSTRARLRRWACGLGGFTLAATALQAAGWAGWIAVFALGWCTLHAWAAVRHGEHGGISGTAAGLRPVDARSTAATSDGSGACQQHTE